MLDVIVYDAIEKKNIIEAESLATLTPYDCLIHTLNVIDFMVALNHQATPADEGINWIILEIE